MCPVVSWGILGCPGVIRLTLMTRLKKQRWLLSAGFFSLADFPQKQQECFSEDHYWFISVDSVGRERSKLFQVVVLILEASITFFLFKLQRQQCASLERCICIDI